jgi:hypothetical protein
MQNIKLKFDKKKELKGEISKIKGKLLIENQIHEEIKRKIDENDEYYKDQLKEIEENLDNKEEYIKIFEKKLKEVEIYVQKNTKNLTNSKFEVYKDFKINDFIITNTDLCKKKDQIEKDIIRIKKEGEQIRSENKNYLQETLNSEMDCSFGKGEQSNKIKQWVESYKNQIKIIEMRNSLLKNYFTNMTSRLKGFSDLGKCKYYNILQY